MISKEVTFSQLMDLIRQKAAPLQACFHFGATIEKLILQINLLGGSPTIMHNGWYGIKTAGSIMHEEGKEEDFSTSVSGESLVLSLLRTYEQWKEKWEELNKKTWPDPSFVIVVAE